jgi:hypothetical protein
MPSIVKRIVCLANSRKIQHRCVAGKDTESFKWVRPVGSTPSGELTEKEIQYSDGRLPKVLDILDIPLEAARPKAHQPENYLISNKPFKYVGRFSWADLDKMEDAPDGLWNIGPYQNRVAAEEYQGQKNHDSLYLIKPTSAELFVDAYESKKKLELSFTYQSKKYTWKVTDIEYQSSYFKKPKGFGKVLDHSKIYLCVSLGEPFPVDNHCYKLVAAIITPTP